MSWQQCRFDEIQGTERFIQFDFKDGSILKGKPERVERTEILLWVGYMLRQVTLTEVKKGKATISRMPELLE